MSPDNRRQLGQQSEDLPRAHIEEAGYIVRDTNYRCLWGEVDIVVEKNEEIVFVEVTYATQQAVRLPRGVGDGVEAQAPGIHRLPLHRGPCPVPTVAYRPHSDRRRRQGEP